MIRPQLFNDPYIDLDKIPPKLQYKRIGGILFVGAQGYWAAQIEGYNVVINQDLWGEWWWGCLDPNNQFEEQREFCPTAALALKDFQTQKLGAALS